MALAAARLDPRGPAHEPASRCRLPERALRLALAAVLMLSGVKLLDLPTPNWVIAFGAVVAGLAFATWGLTTRLAAASPEIVKPS